MGSDNENIRGLEKGCDHVAPLKALLLDSSLISETKPQKAYTHKVIRYGGYVAIYKVENIKIKDISKNYVKSNFDELNLRKYTNNKYDKDYFSFPRINEKKFRLICFSQEFWNIIELKKYKLLNFPINNKFKIIITTNTLKYDEKDKSIDFKNIMRSKLSCQRLAKCNADEWKTFITLTFSENITNIEDTNAKLHSFFVQIRRVFKDFKYLCIPEFQKRGAVHYHLLTNIDVDNTKLIFKQENNKKFLHIKFWLHGFTKVDIVKSDIKKIVGYISKYMTKEIDDKLFGKRRYLYSQNLCKPETIYFDINDLKDNIYFNSLLLEKEKIYENTYINPYTNETIVFTEYLKNN